MFIIDVDKTALDFFFFQAEDGIRDLVRSRGLGDVYKRQVQRRAAQCDRRIWELHLMSRAIEVLPQLRVEADRIYGLLLHTVSPAEIRMMRSSLAKMSGNLESVLGGAAVGADPEPSEASSP